MNTFLKHLTFTIGAKNKVLMTRSDNLRTMASISLAASDAEICEVSNIVYKTTVLSERVPIFLPP